MHGLYALLVHHVVHGLSAILNPTIDAGSEHELCSQRLTLAEKLINVAFAVSDMHAAFGFTEIRSRLSYVLQPADAFFLFDGDARGVDRMLAAVDAFALEGIGSLELLARPELDRRQPERQAIGGDSKARVHEDAADRVHPLPTGFVLVPAADLVRLADRVGVATGEREIGRVVEHEDQPIHRGKALARGLKVSGQDLRLAYAVVVEEAVRRLGAGPISAGQRNRSANAFSEL